MVLVRSWLLSQWPRGATERPKLGCAIVEGGGGIWELEAISLLLFYGEISPAWDRDVSRTGKGWIPSLQFASWAQHFGSRFTSVETFI